MSGINRIFYLWILVLSVSVRARYSSKFNRFKWNYPLKKLEDFKVLILFAVSVFLSL